MIKYKLLNKDMTTHNGFKWEVGKTYTIDKPGNQLCSDQVFHCYESPETATLFNCRHADIKNPLCYAVECGEIVADDCLKFGTKAMRLIKGVKLPIFTHRQKVLFAINVARHAMEGKKVIIPAWDKWADAYINNAADAAHAAHAADAADAADAAAYSDADYYAAAYAAAAYAAADAAAYAADADAAAYAAAAAAADAAADAAAYSDADYAAADAAAYAAYAADAAADAVTAKQLSDFAKLVLNQE